MFWVNEVWTVSRPTYAALDTFNTCISKVSDPQFRNRLVATRDNIEEAADEYETRAVNSSLNEIESADIVGTVTVEEMVSVYDQRMVGKKSPGRAIYDHIMLLPEGDRCPYCDQRNVSTLDHVLAKTLYPALAVAPLNLVACCMECNKLKRAIAPATQADVILHPYFDDVTACEWLKASIVQQTPCALLFSVGSNAQLTANQLARIENQFVLLQLGRLYSSEAARATADIRRNLQHHFDAGGLAAVRAELVLQRDSRQANRLNSWQSAMYAALAGSGWYCSGGFALT